MTSQSDLYRGLIRVSCIINSIHDYAQLLTSILQITKEVLNCDAGSLMLYEEATDHLVWHVALGEKADQLKKMGYLKMGQGIAGWVAQHRKAALVADTAKDERFFSGADTRTGFHTRSIVCVPLLLEDKLVGVLQALNPLHKKFFDEHDLEVFEAYGAMAATAIEKIRWHEITIQQQKIQQELEIAQEIQSRFLIQNFEKAEKSFQLAFHCQPASHIGGDFYDIRESKDGNYALILGDVTGKGVPAALLMAQILSEFRYLAPKETDPGKILTYLNSSLSVRSARGMFATAWCAVIYPANGSLLGRHASAGHLSPIRYFSEKAESIEPLSGLPLGIIPESEYPTTDFSIKNGELLCIYTDGITESRNLIGEEFGTQRMQNLVASLGSSTFPAKEKILESVTKFGEGTSQRDDITFLVCAPHPISSLPVKQEVPFRYQCASCPSQMADIRTRIRQSASAFGFDEDTITHLVLAVDEACTNIIRHAYDGKSSGKIEVDVKENNHAWEVRLRDYGKKCNPGELKGRDLHEVKPGGLGLFFIKKTFDEVYFEPLLEEGNCLILRKKK